MAKINVGDIVEGLNGENAPREYYFITQGIDNNGKYFMPVALGGDMVGRLHWMYKFRTLEEIEGMFNRQFGDNDWGICPQPFL